MTPGDVTPPPLAGHQADDDALWGIFSGSRNPMVLADDQRRYVNANRAACQLLGYGLDELRTMRIDDVTVPEHRQFLDDVWDDFLERGGSVGQFAILRADGTRVNIEFNATAHAAPGLHLSVFINHDATGDATEHAEDDGSRTIDEPVAAIAGQGGRVLDDTERRVMTLLARGLTWHEVADEIDLTPSETHAIMESAMTNLGARTRAHAVSMAICAGEIDPHGAPRN